MDFRCHRVFLRRALRACAAFAGPAWALLALSITAPPALAKEPQPRLTAAVTSSGTVSEPAAGTGSASFRITLSRPPARATYVMVAIGGTATRGADYSLPAGLEWYHGEVGGTRFTLSFGPHDTAQTVTVTVNADDAAESAETVTATLTDITPAGGFATTSPALPSATITIVEPAQDGDPDPPDEPDEPGEPGEPDAPDAPDEPSAPEPDAPGTEPPPAEPLGAVDDAPGADGAPALKLDDAVAAQRYVVGDQVALTLPAARGGAAPVRYTLAPAAPAGLAFAAAARTLSGTPAAAQAKTAYTLTATDAGGTTAALRFTIEVIDRAADARRRALGEVLAAFGSGLAADAVDVIGTRFTATGSAIAVGGRERLFGAAAVVEEHAGAVSVWGRGAMSGFYRSGNGVTVDGAALTGYLGFDYGWRDPTADGVIGVAVALSRAERVSYRTTDGAAGAADLTMTAVLPYAHLRPAPGAGVWGLAGGGRGPAALQPAGGESIAAEMEMRLVAGGAYLELAAWENIGVALEADGFLTTLQAESAPPSAAPQSGAMQSAALQAHGEARRIRALVSGRGAWELAEHSHLRTNVEVGGLWNGADQLGAEVGGGVEYHHTGIGLGVDARGRYLLAQNPQHREWGAGVTLRYAPGGTGLWFALGPSWGSAADRVGELWANRRAYGAAGAGAAAPVSRAGVEVGYRFDDRFEMSVAWTREAPPAGAPAHRVRLSGALRW